jgi:hypothetical protein
MTSNGDSSSEPTMHGDSVKFLRLLPPNREADPYFDSGVAFFLCSAETDDLNYLLTVSRDDAQRIVSDLKRFLAGKLDVANPGENYGE